MSVYIIRAGDTGKVKIGFTADSIAARRLAKMQTDNPERLVVIRWLAGGYDTETDLQRRYAHLRVRGDWFRYCDTMLGDLGIPDAPPPPIRRHGHALRQYIADEGLTIPDFATAIGVSVQSVHRYVRKERIPTVAVMGRIQSATGGKVRPNDFFASGAI